LLSRSLSDSVVRSVKELRSEDLCFSTGCNSHWLLARCSVLKVRRPRAPETRKSPGEPGDRLPETQSIRSPLGSHLVFGCQGKAGQIQAPFSGPQGGVPTANHTPVVSSTSTSGRTYFVRFGGLLGSRRRANRARSLRALYRIPTTRGGNHPNRPPTGPRACLAHL